METGWRLFIPSFLELELVSNFKTLKKKKTKILISLKSLNFKYVLGGRQRIQVIEDQS